jgi:hypothetical protein
MVSVIIILIVMIIIVLNDYPLSFFSYFYERLRLRVNDLFIMFYLRLINTLDIARFWLFEFIWRKYMIIVIYILILMALRVKRLLNVLIAWCSFLVINKFFFVS